MITSVNCPDALLESIRILLFKDLPTKIWWKKWPRWCASVWKETVQEKPKIRHQLKVIQESINCLPRASPPPLVTSTLEHQPHTQSSIWEDDIPKLLLFIGGWGLFSVVESIFGWGGILETRGWGRKHFYCTQLKLLFLLDTKWLKTSHIYTTPLNVLDVFSQDNI